MADSGAQEAPPFLVAGAVAADTSRCPGSEHCSHQRSFIWLRSCLLIRSGRDLRKQLNHQRANPCCEANDTLAACLKLANRYITLRTAKAWGVWKAAIPFPVLQSGPHGFLWLSV